MARSGKIDIPLGTIVELTNANIGTSDTLTFFNDSVNTMRVIGTTDTTPPTVEKMKSDGLPYAPQRGEGGRTLDEIFRGAGFIRLWAYSVEGGSAIVYHE